MKAKKPSDCLAWNAPARALAMLAMAGSLAVWLAGGWESRRGDWGAGGSGGRGRGEAWETARSAAAGELPRQGEPSEQVAKRGEDWPQWRGRRGDSSWRNPPLAEDWTRARLDTVWSAEIAPGYSGIAVVGERLFTMDRPVAPAATCGD